MKKTIGLVLVSLSLNAWAAQAGQKASNPEENRIMARLTEQLFSKIDKASIDIDIGGISIDSSLPKGQQVKNEAVRASGIVSFMDNLQVDLMEPSEDADAQMQKVYPKLVVGTKGQHVDFSFIMKPNGETLLVRFFAFNREKKWGPSSLTLKASNQMNKDLLTINLHSLTAERKIISQNPIQHEISGTCVSDKSLLDMTTGKVKTVQVDCKFSGTMTEKGYKLNFRYANK